MKKLIIAIGLVTLIAVCFAGCGKSEDVKAVITMIKQVGEITNESGEALNAVADAYNGLNEKEKKQVGNYKKYEKMLEKYDEITAFNNDILAVVNATGQNLTEESMTYDELIARGKELIKEYGRMNKRRRQSVIPEIDKVEDAVKTIEGFRVNAIKCASSYVNAFLDINGDKNYTVKEVGCICQIWKGAQYMFFALTAVDGDRETSVYSQARFSDPAVFNAMKSNPDIFFAEKPFSEDANALVAGNFALTVDEILTYAPAEEETTAAEEPPEKTNEPDKAEDKAA